MCDAVVVPTRPENETSMASVCCVESYTTVVSPVPGEVTVGTSAAPVSDALKVCAVEWVAAKSKSAGMTTSFKKVNGVLQYRDAEHPTRTRVPRERACPDVSV